jgi:rubrerythrin
MKVEDLLFAYVAAALGTVAVLVVQSDMRRRRFGPRPSADHIFRCEQCGYVYTDDPDVDRSRCPQCGQTNDLFQF